MYRWAIAASLLVSFSAAAISPDSSDNGEEKFIRLTHQLEDAPLGDTDKSIRTWLIQWTVDSQDIAVVACDVMDSLSESKTPNAGIYTTQMMFGNAAYQIANPDKRDDLVATQLAGVRSALKAYQSVLAKDPGARILHFDELMKKDKDGTLQEYLTPIIDTKCSKQDGT